jgi:hypothetical protein
MTELLTPKICKGCGEPKERSEFHKKSGAADGLRGSCKACRKKEAAAYRASHKDEIKQRAAEYYAEHKDEIRQKKSVYRGNHQDEIKKRGAAYRASHKEEIRQLGVDYRASHKEEKRQYDEDHRDRIRQHDLDRSKLPHRKEAHRLANAQYRKRNRLAALAHRLVARALRDGALVKPKVCSRCPETSRIEAHHEDYTRPLEVWWLCYRCHKQRTKELREQEKAIIA